VVSKTVSIAFQVGAIFVLFLVVNTVHFQFLPVRVVLYDSLLDILIAGIIGVSVYFIGYRDRIDLTPSEGVLAIVVGLLCAAVYAVAVLAVIDRSLSIYILEKVDQRGGQVRQGALEEIIKQEYLREHQVTDVRITEQLNSGTITVDKGCIRLTPKGEQIVRFTRFFRTTLLPKKREILGKFSDDLTDPFRNSKVLVPSKCD
jgi:multisubunit Na+/H+ antiporter MnhB subunit